MQSLEEVSFSSSQVTVGVSVAATIESRVGVEGDDLVWQQPKEEVQGKPATHAERESAT